MWWKSSCGRPGRPARPAPRLPEPGLWRQARRPARRSARPPGPARRNPAQGGPHRRVGWRRQPIRQASPASSAARSRAAGKWDRCRSGHRFGSFNRSRSCARSAARIASSPIHVPDPSSPSTGPQPPAPKSLARSERPIAFDPVPATTRIPGPPAKAASSAISSSPHSSNSPATSSVDRPPAHARTAGLLIPASPKHVRVICPSETPAAAATSASIACSRAVASASETRISFTVPVVARASTRVSSASRHCVLVPPASMARK